MPVVESEGHCTTQTNSLQILSVIRMTEAKEEFCAKSYYKTKRKTKPFLKASLGRCVAKKVPALEVLPWEDPLACTELHADICSILCNFSTDLP